MPPSSVPPALHSRIRSTPQPQSRRFEVCRRPEATTSRRLVRRCARAPLKRCAALRRIRCLRRACGLRRLLHAGVDAAALPALPVALLQRLQLEEWMDKSAEHSRTSPSRMASILGNCWSECCT
nr:uncharacterized protein LOC127314011 [Lolium perenne]